MAEPSKAVPGGLPLAAGPCQGFEEGTHPPELPRLPPGVRRGKS